MMVTATPIGGVGAIISWLYVGYGIVEGNLSDHTRGRRVEQLAEHFATLRLVLFNNDDE